MTEKINYIPARLKNATHGGYVTGTEDIIDTTSNKTQKEINATTEETIALIKEDSNENVNTLKDVVAKEKARAENVELNLDSRVSTVEQHEQIMLDGGTIGIGTASDFINRSVEGDAKIPTINAIINGCIATIQSNISIINKELSDISDKLRGITEDCFSITDNLGNVCLKYDNQGFDVALLTDHFKSLIKSIDGLGLALGETSNTAYAGDKGKTNAENIALINSELTVLIAKVEDLRSKLRAIQSDAFSITDTQGNVGLLYDNNGLDAALLSEHFKLLITKIDGLGLKLGETSDTAYAGNKGKENADNISNIQSELTVVSCRLEEIRKLLRAISNDSFTITDSEGNIGFQYNQDGLDVALLSEHFISLLKNISGIGIDYDVIGEIDE